MLCKTHVDKCDSTHVTKKAQSVTKKARNATSSILALWCAGGFVSHGTEKKEFKLIIWKLCFELLQSTGSTYHCNFSPAVHALSGPRHLHSRSTIHGLSIKTRGNVLASRSKVRGFKSDSGQRIFSGRKNPEHKSSRRDFKQGIPSLRFQAR